MIVAYFVSVAQKAARDKEESEIVQMESVGEEDEEQFEDIEKAFNSATMYLPTIVQNMSKHNALSFYGLYKQANQGDADDNDRPSIFSYEQRHKFDAWAAQKGLSKTAAKKKYCRLLAKVDPSWDPTLNTQGGGWNLKPSIMETITPEMFGESGFVKLETSDPLTDIEKKWFELMKLDMADEMAKLLETNPELIDTIDDEVGLTALARSIDLGCENVAMLLIKSGADVNIVDQEGSTPLHYAAQCHRVNMIELLIGAGANRMARDNEGMTPFDWCDRDTELEQLLMPSR